MSVESRKKDMYDCIGWVRIRHTLFSPRRAWYMRLLGSTLTLHELVHEPVALEYSLIGCKIVNGLLPWLFTLKLADGTKLRVCCESKGNASMWKEAMRRACTLLFDDEFELLEKIEETDSGAVFNAVDKFDDSKVRVQRIVRDPFEAVEFERTQALSRQLYAVQNLGHQNLLWAFSTFHESEHAYIVTRRVRGRRLSEVLCERGGRLGEVTARNIAKQLVEAISYMHHKGFVLRNLSLDTVLYDENDGLHGRVTLADFSQVAFVDDVEDLRMRGPVGNVRYQAPEMLKGWSYCAAVDLFALGVCVYRMLCGSFPFGVSSERRSVIIEEREGSVLFSEDRWNNISEEAKGFVESLLRGAMFCRMTASDAEDHAWLHMVIPEQEEEAESEVENVTTTGSKEEDPTPGSKVNLSQANGVAALLKRDEAMLSPWMRHWLSPLSGEAPLSVKSAVDQFAKALKQNQCATENGVARPN